MGWLRVFSACRTNPFFGVEGVSLGGIVGCDMEFRLGKVVGVGVAA